MTTWCQRWKTDRTSVFRHAQEAATIDPRGYDVCAIAEPDARLFVESRHYSGYAWRDGNDWRAECTCGWFGTYWADHEAAMEEADWHGEATGQFPEREEITR